MMLSIVQFIYVMITVLCWKTGENDAKVILNRTNPTYNSTINGTIKPNSRFCFVIGFDCLENALNGEDSCLAGDGLARLVSGGHKQVSDLQAGDRVFAMDQNNPNHIIETDVIMIMHRVSTEYVAFYAVETEDHQTIYMTPGHFVPVLGKKGDRNYIQAQRLTTDDYVFVAESGKSHQLVPSKIISISVEVKLGYYSPLTTTGTLIVDNIAVSCYSNVVSHEIAHIGMAPVRWIHSLARYLIRDMDAPFKSNNSHDTVHWIPGMMQKIAQTLLPQILSK